MSRFFSWYQSGLEGRYITPFVWEDAQASRFLLIFQLAGYECAIPCERVQEVVSMAATAQSPAQPSTIEGFLNLRGEAIPVVILRRLFALPEFEPGIHTPVIIARLGDTLTGLLVDRVNEVATIDSEGIKPLAEEHSLNECADAYVIFDGRRIVLLDCDRLLLKEEKKRIAELQAAMQFRLRQLDQSRDG
jgi:purine-binding chemotaxis protein CheW